ncbi:MAG: hypothetical protein JOZ51_02105 [Chloroflexi bacterium]|nr:hypothetical protein [Chloroflexota bacterium]
MNRSLLILHISRWAGTEGMVIGALAGACFALGTTLLIYLRQITPERLTEPGYLIPGLILIVTLSVLAAMIGGALGGLLGFIFGGLCGLVLGVCSSRLHPMFQARWRVALICLSTTLILEMLVLRLLGVTPPPAPSSFDMVWAWLSLLLPLGCAIWGSYRLCSWRQRLALSEHDAASIA